MADISDANAKWVLESVEGRTLAGESKIFFQIEDGVLSGFDGCNRFAGPADDPANLRGTQRGCPPEVFRIHLAKARKQLESLDSSVETVVLPVGPNGEQVTFRRVGLE